MSLITISLCVSDIPKDKIKQADNGKKYLNLCVSKRREIGQFGETHTVFISNTKEEREANAPTIYVGSGKEYAPPQPVTAENIDAMPVAETSDGLPF